VDDAEVDALVQRLRQMNPRAQQKRVHMGETDIKELIDIRGFNLNAALEVDPEFLTSDYHEHDDDVTSFVWKDARPMHMEKIETFPLAHGPELRRGPAALQGRAQQSRASRAA
jgi:G3E family GTPase